MKLLKEIVSLCNFFWKIPEEEKKIVIYAEHDGYYSNYEGLIEELIAKNQQNICYITSDSKDPILEKERTGLKTFYLKNFLPFFMLFIKCKVFIMTMPDLNQFHIKRSINPVHYVYIFHAIVSTHMVYRGGSFDYYDSILCVGPHHIEEIRKYEELHKLPCKKLIKAGFYRLERIYAKYKEYLIEKSIIEKKYTILIAPSWGVNNIIESCGKPLVKLLLKKRYKVIVRPHPETIRRFPKLIEALAIEFSDNPDFYLERSIATDDSVLKSDILICDCSGIALEYAFGTERPVLFLDVPYKIRNEKFKELDIEPLELFVRKKIGIVVSPKKLDTIPQVIAKLKSEEVEYKERIIRLREKYIYNFRHSSKISAKYIIDIVEH
jgi:YidC/Oxa1 family membrane protein insertase